MFVLIALEVGADGEYDSDPEDEELFELEGSMNSPEERMNTSEDMFDADDSMKSWFHSTKEGVFWIFEGRCDKDLVFKGVRSQWAL